MGRDLPDDQGLAERHWLTTTVETSLEVRRDYDQPLV
jgi:hypothetical protein